MGPHRSDGATDSAAATAVAELDAILARLGPIADRVGNRAAVAQYEADIGDPARTRAGTSIAGRTGPLPRFLPMRDIIRISFNICDQVSPDTIVRRLVRSSRLPADDNLTNTLPYAPTLRAALDLGARYNNQMLPWFRWLLEIAGDELNVIIRPVTSLGRIEALSTELSLTSIHRIVETFVGDRIGAARVNFAMAPVSDPVLIATRFACPVGVGGNDSLMTIPASWGDLPSPYHDPRQWIDGVARCDADIRVAHELPVTGRVRAHVVTTLDAGRVALIADTARALGMAERTLVRTLAVAGTSHHAIVDTERKGRALRLLAQPTLPIADIAAALDFPDPSSFGRKCRMWFDQTPARMRRQLAATATL